MPACYATCSLYTPRTDLKCRRLRNGLQSIIVHGKDRSLELVRVEFRRWGKLEAIGRAGLLNAWGLSACNAVGKLGKGMLHLPGLPYNFVRRISKRIDGARNQLADRLAEPLLPEAFLLEALNESTSERSLLLTLKPIDQPGLYQHALYLEPGYNRVVVPAESWRNHVELSGRLLVQIEPQDFADAPVVFGTMDFVRFHPDSGSKLECKAERTTEGPPATYGQAEDRPKVKCVVWDLDNTLWTGVLAEDGADTLRVNPKVVAAIVELDRRGILNSIASKNSKQDVDPVLQNLGLADYFLAPQISWSPKSVGVAAIAGSLNISTDTFLFVDDQPFERAEVEHSHPLVETFDARNIDVLLEHPRLEVTVTAEGQRRRQMYMQEQLRAFAMESVDKGKIVDFLRESEISLELRDLTTENLDRAFELTERTNQLNYAGVRLSRSDLEAMLEQSETRGVILSASDRFGDYGIVGLASIRPSVWEVENFFMSCRVQRKKVDHAFFQHLIAVGRKLSKAELRIRYRATAKNGPSREALEEDMGLSPMARGDWTFYCADNETEIREGDIVRVHDFSWLNGGVAAGTKSSVS
jgi:FkbH-like protein